MTDPYPQPITAPLICDCHKFVCGLGMRGRHCHARYDSAAWIHYSSPHCGVLSMPANGQHQDCADRHQRCENVATPQTPHKPLHRKMTTDRFELRLISPIPVAA